MRTTMHPIPVKRNQTTGEIYVHSRALATALEDDEFEPGAANEEAHDWLVWAITVDDPPFPEDSEGRVEVGLERGDPRTTVLLSYFWVPGDGLYLRLKDIYEMIDQKQKQFAALRRATGVDLQVRQNPFAGLRRRIERVEQECES
jgi:hypothetical protein